MLQKAQMLKGLLDGCILMIIRSEETYGYKITEALNLGGFEDLNEGTVYPILVRLEKKSLIKGISKKSPLGPKRKYFSLTDQGEIYLNEFMALWTETSATVNQIMNGGDKNDL